MRLNKATQKRKPPVGFAVSLNRSGVKKMRLIDANKVEIGFDELCKSPYFKSDVNARHGAETLMDLCVRTDSHKPNTIDPETLPIVQKLREQLAKVTAEQDAMLKEIVGQCANSEIGKER